MTPNERSRTDAGSTLDSVSEPVEHCVDQYRMKVRVSPEASQLLWEALQRAYVSHVERKTPSTLTALIADLTQAIEKRVMQECTRLMADDTVPPAEVLPRLKQFVDTYIAPLFARLRHIVDECREDSRASPADRERGGDG